MKTDAFIADLHYFFATAVTESGATASAARSAFHTAGRNCLSSPSFARSISASTPEPQKGHHVMSVLRPILLGSLVSLDFHGLDNRRLHPRRPLLVCPARSGWMLDSEKQNVIIV